MTELLLMPMSQVAGRRMATRRARLERATTVRLAGEDMPMQLA